MECITHKTLYLREKNNEFVINSHVFDFILFRFFRRSRRCFGWFSVQHFFILYELLTSELFRTAKTSFLARVILNVLLQLWTVQYYIRMCVYFVYNSIFDAQKHCAVRYVVDPVSFTMFLLDWMEKKMLKRIVPTKSAKWKRSESLWDLCRDMCTYVLSLCMYNIHVRRVKYLVIKSKVEEKKPENQTKSHHNFFFV